MRLAMLAYRFLSIIGLCLVRPDRGAASNVDDCKTAQCTTRPSSVTNESITTVDKLHYELVASGEILNDPSTPLPTLANGHLGFTVFDNAVYMAGLYNGAGGLSHRARIPNVANIQLNNDCYRGKDHSCIITLDLRSGVFRVNYTDLNYTKNSFRMTHQLYPHALYRRLIVNQFVFERLTPEAGAISLPLVPGMAFTSEDIHFQPIRTLASVQSSSSSSSGAATQLDDDMNRIYQSCGTTLVVENSTYQTEGRPVCVLWNHVPERLDLPENVQTVNFTFLMAVDENVAVAEKELKAALAQTDEELLQAHTSLWGSFWNRFDILMTGNEPLQHVVRASIFYLVSNLPFEASFTRSPGPFWGLSPTGLGRGGTNLDDYEGHSFWDTEIWMFPVLNLIDPWYSRLLITYRMKMLPTARRHAIETGYNGVRFPWESAFTGVEVTQPCCPAVSKYAHHITGDISFALRQYLATTHDLEWLREREGCGMIQSIAEFWSSRVRFNYTGTENYDIPAVMGPDEDHENVTNNAYTNVIAGYALYFGDKRMQFFWDTALQYPVMKAYTLWNDLLVYEPVTRPTGPAMSWSMHAINHLDIGNPREAAENFNRSYQPYIRGPFHVWCELQKPATGARNFLTGAGGFLQAVLYGYAGFRVYLDRLQIRGRYLQELSVVDIAVTAQGVQYLGALITVRQTMEKSEIIVTHLDQALVIEFGDGNVATDVVLNKVYPLSRGAIATIRAKSNPYHGCDLPKDVIGY
uniref:Glycoside hydrolase family 65 central catalytic domain-containing protein n=1 Tax=Anopheles culicifacies TaxID=139723 RepID=A0A182MMR2_9DIPT